METSPAARTAPPEGERPVRVLIVDDFEPLRVALARHVRSLGYEVTEAADGESALDEVLRLRPDIILLDLVLPRMDGYRVMEALAHHFGRGRPRVIVMSNAERVDLARSWLGAEAYLAKPFDPERLDAALLRLAVPLLRRLGA